MTTHGYLDRGGGVCRRIIGPAEIFPQKVNVRSQARVAREAADTPFDALRTRPVAFGITKATQPGYRALEAKSGPSGSKA